MPSYQARMEYVKAVQDRYHRAGKSKKSEILEEFCRVNDYHRKSAIRLLNGPRPTKVVIHRRRPFRYGTQTLQVAEAIWKKSGYLCGQRLKETIPLWLPFARKRFKFSPEVERQLLRISARQLDNRLRRKKRFWKKRVYSMTRPGSLLKHMIPIRTTSWDIRKPGYLEVDLVAHCGNSAAGVFLSTLNTVDIKTGWVERRAVMGKGQEGVRAAIEDIHKSLPFPLRGIDSDNGEEFINYHLLDFCLNARPRVSFTRSRPYKKDDNAHAEQKNWTHVRQIFGWDRFDTEPAQVAMNDLYLHELRLSQNLFQPSTKLLRRQRVGSRVVRRYDKPKAPLQRVIESKANDPQKVKELLHLQAVLDPFELSECIDRKLKGIFSLASQKIQRRHLTDTKPFLPTDPAPPRATPAMRHYTYTNKTKRLNMAMATAISQAIYATSNTRKKEVGSVTS